MPKVISKIWSAMEATGENNRKIYEKSGYKVQKQFILEYNGS